MSAFPIRRLSAALLPLICLCAPAHAATLAIDIAAQPLDSALLLLGQQTSMQISFVPAQVRGLRAAELRGRYTPAAALAQLLRGSGLSATADGSGRYRIHPDRIAVMPAITVQAAPDERIFTQEEIAATPSANRDISDLVATLPSVRTSGSASASANRGSLAQEDISFHGASPYQNLFQIDGVNASNRLDPASKNLNLKIGNIPGNTQAYYVDTALIDQVKVYDSAVPIEYGQFTGGVVDAKLRRASGENHVSASYRWNSSNMTRQHVAEGDQKDWALGKPGYAPHWKKRFYTLNTDLAFSEDFGAVISASRRESAISRYRMGAAHDPYQTTQEDHNDRIDNVLGKFSLRLGADTVSDLSVKLSDRREELVSDFFRDTVWRHRQQAQGVGWNLEHGFDRARLQVQANWESYRIRRESDLTEFVTHRFADRTPRYTTGGFGNEDKNQKTLGLSARLDLDPLQTGPLQHWLYGGVQASRVDFNFKRHSELYSYSALHKPDGSVHQSSKVQYLPGTVNRQYYTMGLYVSDRVQWQRLSLTASARVDRDTLLGNTNISPRSRLDWDALGNGNTVLSAGWARYHGGEILNLALQEDISRLKRQVLDRYGNPVPPTQQRIITRYDGLATPYDDEWSLSLRQRLGNLEGTLSFVRRNGRDQISKQGSSAEGYEYVNNGRSRSETYSLTLATLEPWRFAQGYWTARASLSHQRSQRNLDLIKGYEDSAAEPDDYLIYNGKRMRASELPPGNFNLPRAAHLTLTGRWPRAGLMWDNTLNWKGRRKDVFYLGPGSAPEYLPRYESAGVPSHLTWDTRLTWEPNFVPGLTLSVDVLNVLNRMPRLTATHPNRRNDLSLYRSGREIWLQAGYQF
ncbi:TonB-dependent receptor plug domain-containing protein [Bordetella trematum]|uniref:TonB-dependent receptor plug domain-containing protein n=1 Tax=Bordetella trematum TaxID=123899 RepID=UPI003D0B81F9